MKKNFHYIVRIGFIFAASILFFSCASLNFGKKAYDYEMVHIQDKSDYLVTDISYPVFNKFPELNKRIKNMVESHWNAYKASAKSDWQEINSLNTKNGGKSRLPAFEYSVSADVSGNKKYVSVLITTYIFNGGAHGNYVLNSLNYDVEKQKFCDICEVSNLSYTQLSAICRRELKNKLKITQMIDDGTAPLPGNYEVFMTEDNFVTVFFEPYSVAPYSDGIQKVKIQFK